MEIEKVIKIHVSDKDIDIICSIANGETRALIADRMNISPRTVESKINKLMEIFGAVNQTNLVSIFYKEGVMKSDWSSKTLMELVNIKKEKAKLGNVPESKRDVLYTAECDLFVKREQLAWQEAYKILQEVETK